jgi:carboxylesterase type B
VSASSSVIRLICNRWRYFYNASYPVPGIATHASEIQYVFGNLRSTPVTAAEKSLSKAMQKAWADFAKDPWKGPGWSKVGSNDGKELGYFSQEGQLVPSSSSHVDRNCGLYKEILDKKITNEE